MIKFSKLSEEKIRNFAGEVIFKRGYDYYKADMVENFQYDPENSTIRANIYGTYGIYNIKFWNKNNQIEASCNCPYDGYPCKHIVAVLVYFFNHKESYLLDVNTQEEIEKKLHKKLSALSKSELLGIIISNSKKNPSFKRELMLQLSIDKQKSVKLYLKAIDKIFKKFEDDNFSTYEISHEIEEIIGQIENADSEIRTEIIWKITDSILYQLNEYGMDDIPLEDLAIQTLELLVNILKDNPVLINRRREIVTELEKYCNWRNCGISDSICDAFYELQDS